jgi:hypothetical protein
VRTALFRHGLGDIGCGVHGRELAIAAGPVGTTQTGMGKPHKGAHHYNRKGEYRRQKNYFFKQMPALRIIQYETL